MKLKDFTVMVKINATFDASIKAASLEDALEQAKEIQMKDFVDTDTNSWLDGDLKVYGVFETGK